MSVHTLPVLTAAAAAGAVLAARRAATHRRRGPVPHGAGAARPPWRRTAPSPAAGPPAEASWNAVHRAEEHVHRCWRQLSAESGQGG
ncbi:hypothetical protein QQY24_02890 [Streptomyces sp. TG1A-8]|uniref:hypothetical protein n=1 Tax=Streptomyces sp. TG1A-8 TaxID=3051385 RepID=UPI00265C7CF5|nr:hypothetical protein [Streptomyces sp. TG1A-8]MDO0924411.1 hypothetical protein [Streptomyces sp. TG1A-8]